MSLVGSTLSAIIPHRGKVIIVLCFQLTKCNGCETYVVLEEIVWRNPTDWLVLHGSVQLYQHPIHFAWRIGSHSCHGNLELDRYNMTIVTGGQILGSLLEGIDGVLASTSNMVSTHWIDNADLVCTLELSLVAINPARHSGHSGVVWFTFIAWSTSADSTALRL